MENFDDKNHNDCLSMEGKLIMFNVLSFDELKTLNDNSIKVFFKPGEIIQKQGTFMSHVMLIGSGLAKVYLEGTEQNNTILRIVKPPGFIGGPGIYSDQLYHFTVSAMRATSVCFIDLAVFKNILSQNKAFASEFMKDFSINILSVYNRLMTLTHKKTAGKMAYTLLYLFEEVYDNREQVISISNHDLADLSAISRDSSLKVLRDFQHEAIIRMKDHEIELLKPDTLRMIQAAG